MTTTNLTKSSFETQHELGSIRDGTSKAENMKPATATTIDPKNVDGSKKLNPNQKADYAITEGQKTAKSNYAEEQLIASALPVAGNSFDPIKYGQDEAKKKR